jgi:2-oxoglutarate ferredoxin oxidoreductase subunit delta
VATRDAAELLGDPAITTVYAAEKRVHLDPTIVDYVNIRWVDEWCKRCNICVEICPKDSLLLTHDAIIEATDCIRCGLCERYCPDLAIVVLPKRDEAASTGRA